MNELNNTATQLIKKEPLWCNSQSSLSVRTLIFFTVLLLIIYGIAGRVTYSRASRERSSSFTSFGSGQVKRVTQFSERRSVGLGQERTGFSTLTNINKMKDDRAKKKRRSVDITTRPRRKRIQKPWERYRLPSTINPLHYRISLNVNMTRMVFNGKVMIEIMVLNETNYVVLHASDMQINHVSVEDSAKNHTLPIKRLFSFKKNEYIVAEMIKTLRTGLHRLTFRFNSVISENRLIGVYYGYHNVPSKMKSKVATTFFAPDYARRNFPCFDEPAMKANFTFAVTYDKGFQSISNMPRETQFINNNGHVTTEYKTSVKMSTYLFGYVIGKGLDYRNIKWRNKTEIRFWAPERTLTFATDTLKATKKLLSFYEFLFGIEYSLSKLDMVALPIRFIPGAMENWGVILYRKEKVIYKQPTRKAIQTSVSIIAHELAHQWFGNLVTMKWWNDVWLNEGFASYLEYIGTNHVNASLRILDQFLLLHFYPAMQVDSYAISSPLSRAVTNQFDIFTVFNRLVYYKGASVLRMLHSYLGDEIFFKSLGNYLRRYAYGSVAQDDLWNEFRLVRGKDIKQMMDTWTLQEGFPVVNVVQVKPGELKISQSRFFSNKQEKLKGSSSLNYIWHIPLTYYTEESPLMVQFLFKDKSISIKIKPQFWYKFNVNTTGYYRVNYDSTNWKRLGRQLKENHTVFTATDRAGLISDAFNLAFAGLASYSDALGLSKYLPKETHRVPWKICVESVSKMNRRLPKTCSTRKLLMDYISKLVKQSSKLDRWNHEQGLEADEMESVLLSASLEAKDEMTLKRVTKLFRQWMISNKTLPASIRSKVYFYGVSNGGKDEWKFVYQKYRNCSDKTERNELLYALGATEEPWILQRFLEDTLHQHKTALPTTITAIKVTSEGSPLGRYVAWNFVKTYARKLNRRYGTGRLVKLIKTVVKDFSARQEYDSVDRLLKKRLAEIDSITRQEILSVIESNVVWKETYEDDIKIWLQNYHKIL